MPSIQSAQADFEQAGLSRSQRYAEGTSGKGGKWQSGAAAGEGNYKTGVTAALASGAYGKGVGKAGASAYDSGVRLKGVNNWPTGMQQGGSNWAKGVQPFQSLWVAALSTARGAKRSPNNLKRMSENVERFTKAGGK